MSKVKRFHKKEAARILVELQSKTEDERLMDYRRQLIDNSKPDRQQQACWPTTSMDRQQQACWPWSPNYFSLPPYNTVPIGYPTWLSTPNWTSYMPDTATNPYMQGFSGMEYPANLPWPITMLPHQQVFVDPGQCNRRKRTKFTDEQLAILEKTFKYGSKFPSPLERIQLESKTGLSKEKISVWFQNRRAKEKREKGQDGGSKESTTTDSELETEDERQLSFYGETPEEDSELEDLRNYQRKRSTDFKLRHPVNAPREIIPSMFGGQSTGRFYHSGFNKTSGIKLSHPVFCHTNENSDMKQPRTEIKSDVTTDIKQPCLEDQSNTASVSKQSHLRNIHTITCTDLIHSHPETMVDTRSDVKQLHKEETNAVDSSGPDMTQLNHQNKTSSDIGIEIFNQEGDCSASCSDVKIQRHTSTHTPSMRIIDMVPPSELYYSDVGYTPNHQNNPTSNIKLQHPTNACTYTPTYNRPPHSEDKSNRAGTEVKLEHLTATNCANLGGTSYHMEINDTRRQQGSKTSDTKIPHSEDQSNIPSYIVLSLPGGTIAVESTEQYHREIKETQKHKNIASDAKLPHHTSTPAEISIPNPVGTVAIDMCGRYYSESTARDIKPPFTDTPRNTAEDSKPQLPTNISVNAPSEIEVPHPRESVDVDLGRCYHGENKNTSPSASATQVQLTSSCLDEKPKKRVISETTSSDEKPVMVTHVSSNDVVKKGNDKKSDGVGDAEFTFQNKKVKTGDVVDTCTVTAPCNTSPECRIFGET